jgi:hypothetical protein
VEWQSKSNKPRRRAGWITAADWAKNKPYRLSLVNPTVKPTGSTARQSPTERNSKRSADASTYETPATPDSIGHCF